VVAQMRKASFEPGPAPSVGDAGGGTVSARALAGLRSAARLAPLRQDVLSGLVNRADSAERAD
jgi:hypothetical protein